MIRSAAARKGPAANAQIVEGLSSKYFPALLRLVSTNP
jgi:hypothetical protein